MEELHKLLDRVHLTVGPDPALDEAVASHFAVFETFAQLADAPKGTGCNMYRLSEGSSLHSAYRVTASLDAVVAFMKETLPHFGWAIEAGNGRTRACVHPAHGTGACYGYGRTAPIALLDAILCAKIALTERPEQPVTE